VPRGARPAACLILALGLLAGCASPGSRFVPLGIYSGSEPLDLPALRAVGFNTVVGPARQSFLDAAQTSGLMVLAETVSEPGPAFDPAVVQRCVQALDDHPAVWAWHLADEPDLKGTPPAQVRRAGRVVKAAGARKPTAVVLGRDHALREYAASADLVCFDYYPVPWLPLASFSRRAQLTRLAASPNQPVYAIIQAFDWAAFPGQFRVDVPLRAPTFEELRCMSYLALAHGANGLFYYAYDAPGWRLAAHPPLWDDLKAVVAELEARQAFFKAQRPFWPRRVRVRDFTKRFNAALEGSLVTCLLRVPRAQGDLAAADYLLAINSTPDPLDAEIALPAGEPSKPVPVLGDARSLPAPGGWLTDAFPPYAVRIYGPLPGVGQ
jgi:hypothetical protein